MFGLPIIFSRYLSPLPIDVNIRQHFEIGTEFTEVAIEDGAKVTDHAYVKPKIYKVEFASGNPTATWQTFDRIVQRRAPFTIVTPLAVYRNMLIKDASADMDKDTNKILKGEVLMQEIRIANSAYGFALSSVGGASSSGVASGAAGGADSTRAATPAPSRAGDAATSDAASQTVNRGSNPAVNPHPDAPEQNQSMLVQMFG